MTRPISLSASILSAALAACGGTTPTPDERPDATPLICNSPTTITNYRIDSAQIPRDSNDATSDGLLLDNTGSGVSNQYGAVLAALGGQFGSDFDPPLVLTAQLSNLVDWELAIETCPATGESRVRVGTAGGTTSRAGGTLVGNALSASHGCGEAPVGTLSGSTTAAFVTADQLAVELALGSGELTGTVGFALDEQPAFSAAAAALASFIDTEALRPGAPRGILEDFGAGPEGGVTPATLAQNELFMSLMAPDITATTRIDDTPTCSTDATSWLSLGVKIHAVVEQP